MEGIGFILAALSAVFNGSFASVFKLPKVAAAGLDPILFQLYVSMGVFLSSFIAIPFFVYNVELTGSAAAGTTFVFEPLGLAAGALFVLAISFSFAAVQYIGIALGQGVWGGIAILVSYVWGVAKFGDPISTPWLAGVALILLLSGVLGIAFCEPLAGCCEKRQNLSSIPEIRRHLSEESNPNLTDSGVLNMQDGALDSRTRIITPPAEAPRSSSEWLSGMICAVCVGLCGGSILVPMHYVPDSRTGLVFVVSFGIGTMVASPIVCVVCFLQRGHVPPLHLKDTLLAGLFSGLMYNIGNVLQIIAIPMIGFSIAGPLLQCALFVAGLWGILVFREIRGNAIPVFFGSGVVLISGAVCLAFSS